MYTVIARRVPARWVVIAFGLLSQEEAVQAHDAHCRMTPELWTWAGPSHIAKWAIETGRDPDDYYEVPSHRNEGTGRQARSMKVRP